MKTKKMKTTSLLLLVVLSVLTMVSVSAVAEDVEERTVPVSEQIDDELPNEPNEEPDTEPWVPDYDPNVCIGVPSDDDGTKSMESSGDQTVNSAGIPLAGAIAGFAIVAGSMIVYKRKK